MTLSPENASGPYAGIHAPHTAPSRYHAASTAPLRKTHHCLNEALTVRQQRRIGRENSKRRTGDVRRKRKMSPPPYI
ncbi:hypothetical protein [Prevotella denticola]|uniref:hypothetical protein n=1 Tax=Prevotella denticola TaxID=28129 RepID=UPI001E44B5A3|nr:hypothetical protein [Prevotella denticola]